MAGEYVDSDEALIPFSRKDLTERWLQIGESLKLRDIEAVHEQRLVKIVGDAGTVLGKSVVRGLLTNRYSERLLVILDVCDSDGFDRAKHKQLFALLSLKCLRPEHLKICSLSHGYHSNDETGWTDGQVGWSREMLCLRASFSGLRAGRFFGCVLREENKFLL